jgi:hypothetical protein
MQHGQTRGAKLAVLLLRMLQDQQCDAIVDRLDTGADAKRCRFAATRAYCVLARYRCIEISLGALYRRRRGLASVALAWLARERHIMRMSEHKTDPSPSQSRPRQPPLSQSPGSAPKPAPAASEREIGGPKGPEPTRYGDWEINGRCSDF